jgi:predicted enzyme related to lactoylglutathione lyase
MRVNSDSGDFLLYETENLTLCPWEPEKEGQAFEPSRAGIALRVNDVSDARTKLEQAGVEFFGDIKDTGACHMAFFSDPDGNALILHHLYAF